MAIPARRADNSSSWVHDYGTPDTNQLLAQIAAEFIAAQIACQNGDDDSYGKNQQANNFKTPGPPKPIFITAMSLPWGGLNDIDGDWNPSHYTHNNGQVADIPFSTFVTTAGDASAYDMDRLLLLKAVILSSGAICPYANEGQDNDTGGSIFHQPSWTSFSRRITELISLRSLKWRTRK